MSESKQHSYDSDGCECDKFDYPKCDDNVALDDPKKTIASLIRCLSEQHDNGDCKPQDVAKQLGDDIKEAASEYDSIETVIESYTQFFDKLDCMLADAEKWKREIESWLGNAQIEKGKIDSQRNNYLNKENKKCCTWIDTRTELNRRKDCQTQASIMVEDAKDDFNAYKEFEKLLKSQFDSLKAIHQRAGENRVKKNFTTVYVLYLEYKQVHSNLGLVMTWAYKEDKCKTQDNCNSTERTVSKDELAPEKLRKNLTDNLRKLILARYRRYHWSQKNAELQNRVQKQKESCEKIKKNRVDDLIKEALELQALNAPIQTQVS